MSGRKRLVAEFAATLAASAATPSQPEKTCRKLGISFWGYLIDRI
jgi:hypothetical protein